MTSVRCLLGVDDEPDMAANLARVCELAGWSRTQVPLIRHPFDPALATLTVWLQYQRHTHYPGLTS